MKGTTLYDHGHDVTIDQIHTDVPCRFKDTKDGRASLSIFSRLVPDHVNKIRISNTDKITAEYADGLGGYLHDPTSKWR